MLCRLFCKHAKRCKIDLAHEERAYYEYQIEKLQQELELTRQNVAGLTELVDQYEISLHNAQNDYNKLLSDYEAKCLG